MMKDIYQKLTLAQPATYQIKVPGHLDESWSDWAGGMTITIENEDGGPTIFTARDPTAGATNIAERLSHLASRGQWAEMPHLTTDKMMAEFVVSGTWAELSAKIKA